MLRKLRVQNFAVIDNVEITFEPGLNVITGETGAGKSILIDALGTVLGGRTDPAVLRAGAERAVVEAEFDLTHSPRVREILEREELIHPEEPELLILRREVFASGRSRTFANDTPVPLPAVQEIGDLLVDLHGQHEHQTLLKPSTHILFLDEFAGLAERADEFARLYREYGRLSRELSELSEKERVLQEKRELYEFQLREIETVNPTPEEEEELLQEEKILNNSQRLFEATSAIYNLLYEQEGSVIEALGRVIDELSDLSDIDPSFAQLASDLDGARVVVDEVAKTLQDYQSKIDSDPARLEEVRERLAQYTRLKRRYGLTVEEVLRYRDNLRRQLSEMSSMRDRIEDTQEKLEGLRLELAKMAEDLSRARQEAAGRLEKAVVEQLAELGMPRSSFRVVFRREEDPSGIVELDGVRYRTTPRGIDQVEFYISTNPGQEIRPLAKVASGGEISRIMLALKSVLAHCDPVPTMIFDEIDIGISGRIAQVVGRKLASLSEKRQVLCITHLPQIASQGRSHYLVEKKEEDGTTRTEVRKLSEREREAAVASLLSGEEVSETHLAAARSLLREAKRQEEKQEMN